MWLSTYFNKVRMTMALRNLYLVATSVGMKAAANCANQKVLHCYKREPEAHHVPERQCFEKGTSRV